MIADVVIPAYNESRAVASVIGAIDKTLVRRIVVVDNHSDDNTGAVALAAGAVVLREERRGYGSACLCGLAYLAAQPPDVVVFLDADFSDYPDDLQQVLEPIRSGAARMVIGARVKRLRESGSMMPQQLFGNWLAALLIRLFFGARFTDLGPFRAITWEALQALQMRDRDYGWTVEMQIKAAKQRLPFAEVPVRYRRRIGVSKVSGTLRGTVMAGYKILFTLFRHGWSR